MKMQYGVLCFPTFLLLLFGSLFAAEALPEESPMEKANRFFQAGVEKIQKGRKEEATLFFQKARTNYSIELSMVGNIAAYTKLGITEHYGLSGTSPSFQSARSCYQQAVRICEREAQVPSFAEASTKMELEYALQKYVNVFRLYPLIQLMLGILVQKASSGYGINANKILAPSCITFKNETRASWEMPAKRIPKPCLNPSCLAPHCLRHKKSSLESFSITSIGLAAHQENQEMIDMVEDLLIYVDMDGSNSFFNKAMLFRNGMAAYKLGQIHAMGENCTPDNKKAEKYFCFAKQCGYNNESKTFAPPIAPSSEKKEGQKKRSREMRDPTPPPCAEAAPQSSESIRSP
jgi:hypothetical protein